MGQYPRLVVLIVIWHTSINENWRTIQQKRGLKPFGLTNEPIIVLCQQLRKVKRYLFILIANLFAVLQIQHKKFLSNDT